MLLYLNFKSFEEIDKQMGFELGWLKTIAETIKKNYFFGNGVTEGR